MESEITRGGIDGIDVFERYVVVPVRYAYNSKGMSKTTRRSWIDAHLLNLLFVSRRMDRITHLLLLLVELDGWVGRIDVRS